MCGIVGFIENKDAKEIILSGLQRLEYRGYDSAGLTLFNSRYQQFDIFKDQGRVQTLIDTTKTHSNLTSVYVIQDGQLMVRSTKKTPTHTIQNLKDS
jgi:glucosamine 6-phosphate synthetase-like amidotransferase/phosphosugar isomerase protein